MHSYPIANSVSEAAAATGRDPSTIFEGTESPGHFYVLDSKGNAELVARAANARELCPWLY